MLHPVLPPAPPPLVEPLQPANSAPSTSDSQFPYFGEIDTPSQKKQDTKLAQKQFPDSAVEKTADSSQLPSSVSDKTENLIATPVLAKRTTPETFTSEFSPINASGSAANLGQPQAIGLSVENGTDTNPQVFPTAATNTQNLDSQTTSTIPVATQQEQKDKVTLQQAGNNINISSVSTSDKVITNQKTQNVIEFRSRNSAEKFSVTIKPPSVTSQAQLQIPTQSPSTPNNTTPTQPRIVEVTSDRQDYDEQRRIITAEGNVIVRFDGAILDADRVQVNLNNLIAAGDGDVVLTRGDQILRGQRFTYNLVQDNGVLENGRGEINIPTASQDFAFLPSDVTAGGVPQQLPSDNIRANQPLGNVSSPGGINVTVGGTSGASNLPPPKSGGDVKRVRFEAEEINFYPRGWQARNVRLTNDPFSPPELELRADTVTSVREAPLVDRVTTQRQRLVFDQGLTLPIPINQQTIDRRERDTSPFIVSPGFDDDKRGGFYIERSFTPIRTDSTNLQITPQFYVQRAIEGGDDVAGLFGVRGRLNSVLSSRSVLEGRADLTSFNFDDVEDNLKASLRLRQALADRNPHVINWEYSYRDRLYNGTLGFQTVQSSLGGVLISPNIPLGNSGINLSYQVGAQYINANSDRQDLLDPIRSNDRVSLGRFQGSAALSKGFLLWQGKPLPPTATQGLRYTPTPVVPYLQAFAGVTGTSSYYTSGDNQSSLTGTVGLAGQFGHFSRPFLDYTSFNISYSQALTSGLSPFLFDRYVDTQVLSAGISQQIYGPLRIGFQTSINLDTGEESSTDYLLEYSRRTYGLTLRYNPVLGLGALSIRISDFNWTGGADPFSEIRPVVGGVSR
ncbi:hypothetical protein NOS3756_53730 [Nostoc sp. NIES-3756]|uniref:DUF3769 domain-containing protein n=1 Tax=Nostoc sp. NIES-3756 TaxID=1751286 RepID=UPI00072043B2|nr:DUF3769 domain-containing protein [Nostoc sp. NIES-3756]BAT56368.1 hypothetical protein NOS3756_53730 [Nostoc sp. NIES-3756]BAY35860.1 hypothetical protein NIES2111_01770 [Nostoc sp. NIES-2111]